MIPSPKTSNRLSFKSGGLNIQPKPKFTTVNFLEEAKKAANKINQPLALPNQENKTKVGDSASFPKFQGSSILADLSLKAFVGLIPPKKGLGGIGLSDSNSNPITTNPNIITSAAISDIIFPVFRPEILLLSQFKPNYFIFEFKI